MTAAISNVTNKAYTQAPQTSLQANTVRMDKDGDQDGSKAAEVEKQRPMSGNVGSVVNTTA